VAWRYLETSGRQLETAVGGYRLQGDGVAPEEDKEDAVVEARPGEGGGE